MRSFARKVAAAARRVLLPWIKKDRWHTIAVDELPGILKHKLLYLIGNGMPWSVAILCPCGCGEVIHLSLLDSDSPNWKLSIDSDGLPTLVPSVWRTKGCHSHFFLRHGIVVWCRSGFTTYHSEH